MKQEYWDQHRRGNITYKQYVALVRKDLRGRIAAVSEEVKELKASIASEPLSVPKDSVRELNEATSELNNLKSELDSYKGI